MRHSAFEQLKPIVFRVVTESGGYDADFLEQQFSDQNLAAVLGHLSAGRRLNQESKFMGLDCVEQYAQLPERLLLVVYVLEHYAVQGDLLQRLTDTLKALGNVKRIQFDIQNICYKTSLAKVILENCLSLRDECIKLFDHHQAEVLCVLRELFEGFQILQDKIPTYGALASRVIKDDQKRVLESLPAVLDELNNKIAAAVQVERLLPPLSITTAAAQEVESPLPPQHITEAPLPEEYSAEAALPVQDVDQLLSGGYELISAVPESLAAETYWQRVMAIVIQFMSPGQWSAAGLPFEQLVTWAMLIVSAVYPSHPPLSPTEQMPLLPEIDPLDTAQGPSFAADADSDADSTLNPESDAELDDSLNPTAVTATDDTMLMVQPVSAFDDTRNLRLSSVLFELRRLQRRPSSVETRIEACEQLLKALAIIKREAREGRRGLIEAWERSIQQCSSQYAALRQSAATNFESVDSTMRTQARETIVSLRSAYQTHNNRLEKLWLTLFTFVKTVFNCSTLAKVERLASRCTMFAVAGGVPVGAPSSSRAPRVY